jgi:hypothetical protein
MELPAPNQCRQNPTYVTIRSLWPTQEYSGDVGKRISEYWSLTPTKRDLCFRISCWQRPGRFDLMLRQRRETA